MFGYLDFLFLGFSGRIGRTTYWLSSIALGGLQMLVIWGLLNLAGGTLADLSALHTPDQAVADSLLLHVVAPAMIVGLLFLWPQYAVITKRWHDRGKSGWWSLIVFVPIIGGLWALVELGFLGGEAGVNTYGYR